MEEGRNARRTPLLLALAGVVLLAAVWATIAVAGGPSSAAKPAKAPAAKVQVSKTPASKAQRGYGGHADGRDCPEEAGASNDL
jgi:hypothetical protein